MKRSIIAASAFFLIIGAASCTSPGNIQSEVTPAAPPKPTTTCDRPYVVNDGESEGEPTFIRIDKFSDQDLSKTLLDKKAASSITWDPQPEWGNQDEVIKSVDEVSADTIEEQPFPYAEGLETMIKNSEQSPGLLGYYAATPLTYTFSIQCQNDQDKWYKLSFSTWTDSDLGLLDCNLKLDSEAPDVARKAYGEYCQKS